MIATVVGYLAKTLKDNKSIQGFFSEFSTATVDWIRPLFLKDDGQPKEVLENLQENPESKAGQSLAKSTLAFALEKNAAATAHLEAMYAALQQKATKNDSISIIGSKNVVTGEIKAGGNVIVGDGNTIGKPGND